MNVILSMNFRSIFSSGKVFTNKGIDRNVEGKKFGIPLAMSTESIML